MIVLRPGKKKLSIISGSPDIPGAEPLELGWFRHTPRAMFPRESTVDAEAGTVMLKFD